MRFRCPAVFRSAPKFQMRRRASSWAAGLHYCRAALFAIEVFTGEIVPSWGAKRGGADGAYDRISRMVVGRF